MRKHLYFSLLSVVTSFVLLGAGCNYNYGMSTKQSVPVKTIPAPSSNTQAPAGKMTIKIENFSFQPTNLTVKSGTTVTWTNNDSTPHTVSADDNSFGSGTMSKGDTFTYTFTTPGTMAYYCSFHKSMRGNITITE